MGNPTFSKLIEDSQLVPALNGLRKSWYMLQEGFYFPAKSYLHFKETSNAFRELIPDHWDFTIGFDGSLVAYYQTHNHSCSLLIKKAYDGDEVIQLLPQ